MIKTYINAEIMTISNKVLLRIFCLFILLLDNPIQAQEIINIRNKTELLNALKTVNSGQTIYIADSAKIDLTGVQKLVIPEGVTLASGGTEGGKGGALLFTDKNGTLPLFEMPNPNSRITGLRIRGPDTKIFADGINHLKGKTREDAKKNRLKYYRQNMYQVPVSRGISVTAPDIQIDNNEIYGWTHAGILVQKGGVKINIFKNYIHHNRRFGLGYGVCLDQGEATLNENIFDYNRHSIAGTGRPGTSYEAFDNVFYQNHKNWAVDMHGGEDRKDGTDISGTSIKVHKNIFYIDPIPGKPLGIVIRGIPEDHAIIKNNIFYVLENDQLKKKVRPSPSALYQNKTKQKNGSWSQVIEQKNAQGRLKLKENKVIIIQ